MSDVKTLRLASAQLTKQLLESFLLYQRSLVQSLNEGPFDATHSWAGRFAFAHANALRQCGMDPLDQQRIKVLVSDFCGKRSSAQTVQARAREAEQAIAIATAQSAAPPAKEVALLERITSELARLEDFSAFTSRYGEEALSLLRAHETELVELHRALSRLEGTGGHVHPTSFGA